DDDFWADVIELAVLQAPEDVLDGVAAPAKVGGVPPEEVAAPVVEKVPILRVACAPAPRNRVAFEVDVDTAPLGLLDELRVGNLRIAVGSRYRPISAIGRRRDQIDTDKREGNGARARQRSFGDAASVGFF